MELPLLLIFASFFSFVFSQACDESFLCTQDFCTSACAPKDCGLPDGNECDGVMLELYEKSEDFCSCCPRKCVKYLKENEVCTMEGPYLPTQICGPQLKCSRASVTSSPTCVPMETKCVRERKLIESSQGLFMKPPVCDDEGLYEPLQCYPGGLCRCVDRESGNPVALGFGISSDLTQAEESGMNCQCASSYHESLMQGCKMQIDMQTNSADYKAELEKCMQQSVESSSFGSAHLYFSLGHSRCLPNGNYDPIQCVNIPGLVDGICVCVNPWSEGDHLTPNGTTSYQSTVTDLHCYDPDWHTVDYYRPCEKQVFDIQAKSELLYGQTVIPLNDGPICTPDGYFAKLQHNQTENTNYCADRNGHVIEDFANVPSTSSQGQAMNCECALARAYLSDLTKKPSCCSNGNFNPKQCVAGFCFCVNLYGQQIGLEVDQLNEDSLQCGDFCCDQSSYAENEYCYQFMN